jgi:hypothetical protein
VPLRRAGAQRELEPAQAPALAPAAQRGCERGRVDVLLLAADGRIRVECLFV